MVPWWTLPLAVVAALAVGCGATLAVLQWFVGRVDLDDPERAWR